MKNLLLVLFLGSTVTTAVLAESHSTACSMTDGKWSCREIRDPTGDSAISSAVALSRPGGDSSRFEGVATGSGGEFNVNQGGTGIFSGVNPPGSSDVYPGVNPPVASGIHPNMYPYFGIGLFPRVNPSGDDGLSPGVNQPDTDAFSGLGSSRGTGESEDLNPSSDTDDSADHPEVPEVPIFDPPADDSDFRPLPPFPAVIPGPFATAGSGVFPGYIDPFFGTATVARFPFGGAGAFAGAGIPFVNPPVVPGIFRFPTGFSFGGARALAYAGRRK